MRRVLLAWLLLTSLAGAQPRFDCVVLGAHGGSREGDLSAYLLAPAGSHDYLCLDAGTLLDGLTAAGLVPPGPVLRQQIRAYLLSHPHLDHLMGLVLNSPQDSPKPILGLASTLDTLRDQIFTDRVWVNFGNEGERPLGRYTYVRLQPGVPVPCGAMTVEAWPLSHTVESTAFLLGSQGEYVVYCGDTGPDAVENSDRLGRLWERIAPLVRAGHVHALFLEASFPDPRPDDQLFGHLTPRWMLAELHRLKERSGSLEGLTVVVTHIKSGEGDPDAAIAGQLESGNDLGVRFLFPHQGERLQL